MSQSKLSAGSACILVRDPDVLNDVESKIYQWLRSNGFEAWKPKGWYDGIDWIYININSKTYMPGMPGVSFADVIGSHAVTFDEFLQIYHIFQKYESLKIMYMSREEQETRERKLAESKAALERYWATTSYEQYREDLVKMLIEDYNYTPDEIREGMANDEEYIREQFDSKNPPGATVGGLHIRWSW